MTPGPLIPDTAHTTPLTPETEAKVDQFAHTDILVGFPSFNNVETIGHVVKAVSAGLAKYFPEARAVLVNSGGGSTDGTQQVVAQAVVDLKKRFLSATGKARFIKSLLRTTEALAVLDDPALAPLFAEGTLAEVGVTAPLGSGRMLGSIDRLVVTTDRVLAVDFKTNNMIPDRAEDVPEGLLRQMGAYAAALAQIWPGRRIETAILWTRQAMLMPLPPDIVRAAMLRAAIP